MHSIFWIGTAPRKRPALKDKPSPPPLKSSRLWIFGAALAVASFFWCLRLAHGGDFVLQYSGSRALLQGLPMYAPGTTRAILYAACPPELTGAAFLRANDPDGCGYPPSNAVLLLPFAALPFSLARIALYCVMALTLLYGVHRLQREAAPHWTRNAGIVTLLIAQQSVTVRWGLGMLQIAPLIAGLFALYLVAAAQKRDAVMAVLTALALCLKLTLGFPFLLFAALLGRYRVAAFGLAACLAVSAAGFARAGGAAAIRDYARQVANVQALNANSPDPYLPGSFERIDLEYLFNGLCHDLSLSRILTPIASGAALLFLLWAARKTRVRRDAPEWRNAFAAPTVCLSLLAVFHHKYDASLLLIPLLLTCAAHPKQEPRTASRIFIVAAALLACIYPVGRIFAEPLGHLLRVAPQIVERLSYSVLLAVAFAASLQSLWIFVRQPPRS